MKKLSKKIFVTAGYNTIFMGTGRAEFNPSKPMRSFEEYLKETANGTISQIKNADLDEGVTAILRRSESMVKSRKSMPSTLIKPLVGSYSRGIKSARVVLPACRGPMIATAGK